MSKFKRNKDGLVESANYQYGEDGYIDWRKMIKSEFLYPNKEWFEKRNKPIPSSVEGLEDYQLLIKLGGIKELARLRGFTSVRYIPLILGDQHVSFKCEIKWIPNVENPEPIIFESIANATVFNTHDFGAKFLESFAENRAFIRCVRNFLNIHIVGGDEIDSSGGKALPQKVDAEVKHSPLATLQKNLELGENDFGQFKDILKNMWKKKSYQNEEAAKWENWGDIPTKEVVVILKKLKIN